MSGKKFHPIPCSEREREAPIELKVRKILFDIPASHLKNATAHHIETRSSGLR